MEREIYKGVPKKLLNPQNAQEAHYISDGYSYIYYDRAIDASDKYTSSLSTKSRMQMITSLSAKEAEWTAATKQSLLYCTTMEEGLEAEFGWSGHNRGGCYSVDCYSDPEEGIQE